MAKALYRKYRPKTLAEVVGQPQVTDILAKSLKQGKISHAYLFIGPRGTGKTSVARIFAHEINGFKYEIEETPVDIIEIDGASNRGIDNIRELREKALIAPTQGKYKVYIIDEVHMLTKEAFNALLKTLEEPPSHVVFIMATTDAYKVPVTITSRAQTYTFELAEATVMCDYLKQVAAKEKIKISDEAVELIVKRGGGSFRDSLSLLDQISTLSKDEITKAMVVSALGLPEDEKIMALLTEYASGDGAKVVALYKDLLTSGIKPETLVENLIGHIIERPGSAFLPLLARLSDIKAPFIEAKLLVALSSGLDINPAPTPSARPSHTPTRAPIQTNTAFDWGTLLNKVGEKNEVIFLQLKKASHELDGNTLHIYPCSKISESILASKNNLNVLKRETTMEIVMHSYGDQPKGMKKDATLSKLSDIMGGEVKNDGGENPF